MCHVSKRGFGKAQVNHYLAHLEGICYKAVHVKLYVLDISTAGSPPSCDFLNVPLHLGVVNVLTLHFSFSSYIHHNKI